jgi:UDP-GlcNAc:undecaprenyl-phosphate GlcNAc-1-phosphate transferase
MNLLICFYTFMTALFTALIIVPFLRKWALDQGTLDIPGERAQHSEPMPTLGGIAIFFSFLLVVLVYVPVTPAIRGFLVGGLIIFVTGLVDDLTNLSPKRKFAGEVVACLAMIVVGKIWLTNLGDLFGFGDIILPVWIGIPFTIFAVVGVINAINLIDGLDGLAGGLSVMALSAFFLLGWITDDQQTALLAA